MEKLKKGKKKKTYDQLLRYSLEIEKIKKSHFPSAEVIKDFLESQDMVVSERTIQRDIKKIRYHFKLAIDYNRSENGYKINYDKSADAPSFFRFLDIVGTAELLTSNIQESAKTLELISFDTSTDLKGIIQLKPLIEAVKSRRKIAFNHLSFWRSESQSYTIDPYMLKEYQNRWYVVGVKNETQELRTFGIDRMSELQVLPETYKVDRKVNAAEQFGHTIGVVYSNHELQQVILSFTADQGKYMKTLPWHDSQDPIIDNEEEYRISLYIKPNYELIQKIMMHGPNVKVIEPQWLADEIKEKLRSALNQY